MRDNSARNSIGARLGANTLYVAAFLWASLLLSVGAPQSAHAAIGYVQGAYATPGTASSMSLAFSSAQAAGDLNVVIVAWGDSTSTVASVVDSKGNTYAAAGAITASSGNESEQIFYAKNVVAASAGANTVTVTFSNSVIQAELRMAEYSGIDTTSPLDGFSGAVGTGLTQNSGSLTTTNANDLLVAGNGLASVTTAAGTGYTLRMTTGEGEILEDEAVTTAGSYSASSTQQTSGYWLIQVAAFKAAAAAAPTITSFTPASGPVGTVITVTGTNLGGSTTTAWVGSAHDASLTNVSSTSVTITVPADAPVASDQLSIIAPGGQVWSGSDFTVTGAAAPTITSFTPTSGPAGTVITVTGTNLGGATTTAWVGAAHDAPLTNVSSTSVKVTVPSDAATGADQLAVFTAGGTAFSGSNFTVTAAAAPTISAFTPASGPVGTVITVTGTNLGGSTTTAWVGSAHDASLTNVSSTSVTITVPADAPVASDQLSIIAPGGQVWSGQNFTVTAAATPTITSFTPSSGPVGTVITVTGTNLSGSTTTAWVGSAHDAPLTNVSSTSVNVTVPADAPVAADQLAIFAPGGTVFSGSNFTVTAAPSSPAGLTVTPYSTSVNILNWTASTSGAGVKNYPVQRCTGSGCSNFAQVAAVTSPGYVDSSLSAGTSYAYRVQAQDVAGNLSGFSGTSAATPTLQSGSVSYGYDAAARLISTQYDTGVTTSYGLDAAGNRTQVSSALPAPGAPGVPSVTAITATTATVSWTAASGTLTGYQYSLNSGAWTSVGTALTVNLSGLSAGTTYTIQVQAVNDNSAGTSSSASFITLPGTPGVPTFTNLTATAVTATWTAASGTVTSYQYSVNGGAWSSVGTALTVNLTGLTPVTAYAVQVRAVNASGPGAASSASVTTLAGTPGVPSFTGITATTATVTWTAAPGTVTSYAYSVNSGAWTSVGTALTATLSGLSSATAYTVQVHALSGGTAGAASSASFTTLPGAPGTPTFTSLTATAATVSWTAASGAITQYQYSVNSGTWTSAGTALTVNLTGLSPVTAYAVQVRAVDVTGPGAASSGSFTTLTPIPSAPGIPSFSNITGTTATVTWTAPSGSVTSYEYSVNAGAWTNTGTALTASLTGLTSATSYTVAVHAINAGGTGPVSSATFSTLTVAGAPGAPSFSNIAATSATVSWTAATGSVTSYAYSVNGGTWTNVGTALTVNLTGLTAGTNSTVQVEAINSGGAGPASTGTLLTLPGSPGVPSTSNITSTTATATWTAPPGIVTSYDYRLEYSLNAGQTWTSVGTAVTVVLTGLTPGTAYTVQVHAVNSSGAGAASSDTFTTQPASPGTPTFTNITPTTATVSWTAAPGTVASYQYSVNSGAWTNVGTALTVNLSGLTQLTSYTVQVQAVNVSGAGPASSAAFTTLPALPGPPGAPSFSNITPTTTTVVWTAASGTVASYQYSVNSGAWVNVGTVLTVNLSGLAPLTSYTVQVQAVNVTGVSTASSAGFTTPPALPGPPGTPSFSNITSTTATASWAAASGTVASYQYSVNSGAWTSVGTALTVNLTGLAPGTSYTVQVEAVNASGSGTASSAGFTTLPSLPGSPGAPSFSSITSTTATASWAAATGTVASYQYSINSGAWISVGTALTVNLTGLAPGTSYTVQVKAVNASGSGAASAAAFTTLLTTDSTTMTIAIVNTGFGLDAGFNQGSYGSMSPTSMVDGKSYSQWWDSSVGSTFALSGFTSNPGQSFLISATCLSVTKTGASATYSYANGIATWVWSSLFGFNSTHTTATCSVVHN